MGNLGSPKTLKPSHAYLLTYLAITTYYRSWPQLICGAIYHELLQLGVNFGYLAFLDSHPPVWPNAGEVYLRLISRLMSLSVFMLEPSPWTRRSIIDQLG